MPRYEYRARDSRGRIVNGKVEASGEQEALGRLEALEYIPISMSVVREGASRNPLAGFRKRVPHREVILFTRQLGSMVKAGLPMLKALSALIEETENENLKNVLEAVREDIQEGGSLSEAMERHPHVFPEMYTSTVSAGEAGGVLDRVLERLSELLEHEAALQSSIRSALRYPMIIIAAITAAFFILTTFVVPAFGGIFTGAGAELPLPTRILIMINTMIREYWYAVLGFLAAAAAAVKLYLRTESGRYNFDYLKLRLPVFGQLVKKSTAARFAQMFATLDEAGLPILKTLDEIAYTLGNAVISRDIASVRSAVQDGMGIGPPLLETKYFPSLLGHMVSVGESTGEMGEMMKTVQVHYDREVDVMIKNLTSLIEPFLIFGLGMVVLFIALGIFLPMWDLVTIYLD